MPAQFTPLLLPLQRTHTPPTRERPHTSHVSSTSFLDAPDFDRHSASGASSISTGKAADVGTVSSRDDTAAAAADVTRWMAHAAHSHANKSALDLSEADRLETWPEDVQMGVQTTQRQPRRSLWRQCNHSQSVAGEGGTWVPKYESFGRRFSKIYRDRMSELRESRGKHTGVRRASASHAADATTHVGLRSLPDDVTPVPLPTSPSKRNGRHGDERPKKRNLLTGSDRKDTPAPPPLYGLPRPASRHLPNAILSAPGGDRARQAAAAWNTTPFFSDAFFGGPDDLDARRSRVGSLSSAADSGADLSSYCGSNASCKDTDGDIDMTVAPAATDFVRVLPSEISLSIFEHLDADDLLVAECVSKTWNAFTERTSVWRNAFNRQYKRQVYTNPPPVQVGGAGCGRPNRPNQEWKKMYRARRELDANWRKGAAGAGKAIYLAGHTDSVYCVQFDEEKIITGSRDRTIRVWDINNFTCQVVIGGPNVKPTLGPKVLRTVDYPDFHIATASVNGTAYGDGVFKVPSQWHDASILCLQYDEKILVTGSSDSDLLVWDIHTYEPIKRLVKHTGGVLDVALDAKHIVSCSKDSRIIVWDRETYEPKGELTGHRGPVNAVQLRGHLLVSASGDGIARLWDLEQMKLVKEFTAKERGLAAVEFSEDTRHVLAGGNDTVTYKFETDTGKEVAQFLGHSQLVRSLWLDSQNSRVVSGSYDLDLRVYDFNTGQEIWRAEEWTTSWMLAAKSDYRRIVATSQDGRILIVDFGLAKSRAPDDGQPIANIDLLRGTDFTTAIQWINPWERDRALRRGANKSGNHLLAAGTAGFDGLMEMMDRRRQSSAYAVSPGASR